jgi:phasin family protein
MTVFQGQLVLAQQANVDFFFGLVGKMLEGEEKLIRLTLDMVKTTFSDWYQRMQDGLTKKDGQEVTGLHNVLALPSAEKIIDYERQVGEIAATMQTQLVDVVNAQYQGVNRQLQRLVENVVQNTPAGSEAVIAFLEQGASLANTTYESVQRATKHAIDVVEGNLTVAMEAATDVTEAADQTVEKAAKAKVPKQ